MCLLTRLAFALQPRSLWHGPDLRGLHLPDVLWLWARRWRPPPADLLICGFDILCICSLLCVHCADVAHSSCHTCGSTWCVVLCRGCIHRSAFALGYSIPLPLTAFGLLVAPLAAVAAVAFEAFRLVELALGEKSIFPPSLPFESSLPFLPPL